MRLVIYSIVLALVILTPSSLPIEVLGASAPTYAPGVEAGDSWSYGGFECMGVQCSTGFSAITTIAFTIQSVIGPTVTSTATITFTNGTMRPSHFSTNIQTGFGNGSIFTIARGLGAGNPIYNIPSPFVPTINATLSKVYAGRQRSVNMIEVSKSFGSNFPGVTALLWDQKTGILVEFLVAQSNSGGQSALAEHAVLKSTNVWSSENKPHFSLGTKSFFLTAPRGPPVIMTITATSADFSKTISLTTSVFPTGPGPTATIDKTIIAPKDSSATAMLAVSNANGFVRYYIVSLTGVSGTRSDTTFIVVNATIT